MKAVVDKKSLVGYIYLDEPTKLDAQHNYSSILPFSNCDVVLDFAFDGRVLGVEVLQTKGEKKNWRKKS